MKDNLKLIAQCILLIVGPLLAKRGITADQSDVETLVGAGATLFGVVWKFWHWHTTPDAATAQSVPIKTPPALLLLLGLSLALPFAPGCKSTPQQAAYRSAGTVTIAVDAAMTEWGAYVAATHPPIAQEQAVKAAYQKYQAAIVTVCDAGAIYAASAQTNAGGSPPLAAAFSEAIDNAGQSIADLQKLITAFGVKLN